MASYVAQNADFEILNIPAEAFPEAASSIRRFFARTQSEGTAGNRNHDPGSTTRWLEGLVCDEAAHAICVNSGCHVDPDVFRVLLTRMVESLASELPDHSLRGRFRLLDSNWGYSVFPFHADRGIVRWEDTALARDNPSTRRFWYTMEQAGYSDTEGLFSAIFASYTGHQRFRAFTILSDLDFDPAVDIYGSAWEFCTVDDEGNPLPEDLVDLADTYFRRYCWKDFGDIWRFFDHLKEQFAASQIPFSFPETFLRAMNCP